MHAQTHQSDPRILGRRTLAADHRHLATLLQPGMSVLDVGCGTGAITAGIAEAVGLEGRVIGVDRDAGLLAHARRLHPQLSFAQATATQLPYQAQFDIVTAARTLQWISDPATAIANMKAAARPGGLVVVLDYNHAANTWHPQPPPEFRLFYAAFLTWRASHGWDNQMASHLPMLFEATGLTRIESHAQDEIAKSGDQQTQLWLEVIDNVGPPIVHSGFISDAQLAAAKSTYAAWAITTLETQTLNLAAVVGRVPVGRVPNFC